MTKAPIRPVMIIISSIKIVYRMVGHGRPAVRSKSMSRRGVVMTLLSFHVSRLNLLVIVSTTCIYIPVNVSHIEDLAEHARNLGVVVSDEFHLNASLAKIGAHGEIGNGSDHGDGSSDVVEHAVGARLGKGETGKDQSRGEHHGANRLHQMVSGWVQSVFFCSDGRNVQNTSQSHGW